MKEYGLFMNWIGDDVRSIYIDIEYEDLQICRSGMREGDSVQLQISDLNTPTTRYPPPLAGCRLPHISRIFGETLQITASNFKDCSLASILSR
jgi:hypothetical protein